MPMYEYSCGTCGQKTELIRRYAQRDEPASCPDCGAEAKRGLSAFAVRGDGIARSAPGASAAACNAGG